MVRFSIDRKTVFFFVVVVWLPLFSVKIVFANERMGNSKGHQIRKYVPEILWFGLVCFLEPKLRNFVILVLIIKQGQRLENVPNFSRLKKPVQTRCRSSIFTAES